MLDLGYAVLDLGLWLADWPEPIRVSASLVGAEGKGGVEQSGSALVVC